MTTLNDRQNSTDAIECLCAQSQLYTDAKVVLGIYLLLSIGIVLFLNLCVVPLTQNSWLGLKPIDGLSEYITLYTFILALIELFFVRGFVKRSREKAAKIQEYFDYIVYQINWNDIVVGDKPDLEMINKAYKKYIRKGKDTTVFQNWYTPDIADIADENKINFLCQRENLSWDSDQRSSFSTLLWASALFVFISCFIAAYALELDIKQYLLFILIPSWPAVSYAYSSYIENKDTVEEKLKLKAIVQDKLNSDITSQDIRLIQDMLYNSRKNAALIFDWYYVYYRDVTQEGVSKATSQLIKSIIN
ncbi:S-4TM family putative pore-forming effector [Vibrio alginolyticus]|uniref:S-4TM family putative pore-forming effector n=1 Tax=Vibrio alginolyticus TaxID=663 RepID=UPI00215BBDC5|nr:S-4TM family putative pore-forming effector [Vibrio alginolyticus]MCR9520280.1 S-4TM family putative pore-forming effector [Vibrio alginolyticus]